MMAPTNPTTHHLASIAQASSSSNYKDDFSRFKEDLADMIKTKLEYIWVTLIYIKNIFY